MSTLLHPSFKQFQIAREKPKAIDLVKKEILKHRLSRSFESSGSSIVSCSSTASSTKSKSSQIIPTTKNILLQCCDVLAEDKDLAIVPAHNKELLEYMDLNEILEPDSDVLLFWKEHQKSFPTLASMVASLYGILPSNTTVEFLFSTDGNTLSDQRTNLGVEKINKLLFLNKNLLLWKEDNRNQLLHIQAKEN